MRLNERVKISLGLGLLSWLGYTNSNYNQSISWKANWYVNLMSAAPIVLLAFFFAILVGIISHRTSIRNWWYPGSAISKIICSLSLLGLVAVSSLPIENPLNAYQRLTIYSLCLCLLFSSIMGFAKGAFEEV